jgi:hypothetical protein
VIVAVEQGSRAWLGPDSAPDSLGADGQRHSGMTRGGDAGVGSTLIEGFLRRLLWGSVHTHRGAPGAIRLGKWLSLSETPSAWEDLRNGAIRVANTLSFAKMIDIGLGTMDGPLRLAMSGTQWATRGVVGVPGRRGAVLGRQ